MYTDLHGAVRDEREDAKMKTAKTVLALLLCLCMLPFSALAVTIQPGGAVSYTPAESGLYAVTVQKDGKTLDPLPAKAAIYEPAMAVSVTAGETAAQAVDYNVFYLVKGTQYSVQLKNISDGAYDDAGEWDVSVQPVKINALSLNADTLVEGEWFSFTPDADGSYAITAASAPVFVEVLTEDASVSGDWAGYALDKEKCRVGMELDYLRSLKTAMKLREETLAQGEQTYQKALDKLENYNKMIDLADKTGIGSEGSNLFNKKQLVYDALKKALLSGDDSFEFSIPIIGTIVDKLNLPSIDRDVVENLPEKVTDLPDYLSGAIRDNEKIRDTYENQKAEQEADQARYDAGLAANPQLADLVENTSTETATLRQQVKTDADAIMSGAAALAADAAGMKLVAADWQNTESSSLSVTLAKGVTYIIHALSNLTTSASVTDSTVTPPEPTVDKTALNEAITDAKAVDTDLYTEDSVAAMQEALGKAEAVQKNDAATQTEVDDAAKALNDAVKALKKKDDPTPQTVDKSALEKAIADAKAVEAGLYTEDTVAAMQEALGKAEDVQKNDAATQAEVDAAAKALNAAIKALKEKPIEVDKTALKAAIEAAQALERDKYTPASYAAVVTALAEAAIVNLSPNAKQERVDEVTQKLNDAIAALVEKTEEQEIDKSALESAIAAAKAVDKEKYTEDAMQEALGKAEEVNSKADATQDEIDAAAAALNQAVAALQAKESDPDVNKSSLQQLVNYVDKLDRSKYTDESLAALDAAQKTGKDVLADDKADQTAVDNAIKALTKAITALVEKTEEQEIDKSALESAIAAAKAVDKEKYTEDGRRGEQQV